MRNQRVRLDRRAKQKGLPTVESSSPKLKPVESSTMKDYITMFTETTIDPRCDLTKAQQTQFVELVRSIAQNDKNAILNAWCCMSAEDVAAIGKAFYMPPEKIEHYQAGKR